MLEDFLRNLHLLLLRLLLSAVSPSPGLGHFLQSPRARKTRPSAARRRRRREKLSVHLPKYVSTILRPLRGRRNARIFCWCLQGSRGWRTTLARVRWLSWWRSASWRGRRWRGTRRTKKSRSLGLYSLRQALWRWWACPSWKSSSSAMWRMVRSWCRTRVSADADPRTVTALLCGSLPRSTTRPSRSSSITGIRRSAPEKYV